MFASYIYAKSLSLPSLSLPLPLFPVSPLLSTLPCTGTQHAPITSPFREVFFQADFLTAGRRAQTPTAGREMRLRGDLFVVCALRLLWRSLAHKFSPQGGVESSELIHGKIYLVPGSMGKRRQRFMDVRSLLQWCNLSCYILLLILRGGIVNRTKYCW